MVRIISVDGNIGSGKSSFVELLKKYYSNPKNCNGQKFCFLQEPVDIWNTITDKNGKTIIECFYSNPNKYAFAFQMMAYISRLSILRREMKNNYDIIFTERCIFTDKTVFAKMLYDDGKINEVEYKIYNQWFNEFINDFPDIEYIYIKTSPEIAFNRIKKRGRLGENIPLEYLKRCDEYHNNWMKTNDKFDINGDIDSTTNPEIIDKWMETTNNYIHTYIVTFDGACRGNPGPCGAGFVIRKNNKIIEECNHFVSEKNTNNFAEYCALVLALRKCDQLNLKNLIVMGDSNLVIKQMKKEYKIESPNLIPLNNAAVNIISDMNIEFIHIPRDKNTEADRLANIAINKWGKKTVKFDISTDVEIGKLLS